MNLRLSLTLGPTLALCLAASACAPLRVDKAAQVAAGFASHTLCDDVFITGVDPDTAYAQRIQPLPGMGLVTWAMRRQVDLVQREVTVSVGSVVSRARWRQGLGCVAVPADEAWPEQPRGSTAPTQPGAADPWGRTAVPAADPRLRAALDRAVTDPPGQPPHRSKAVLVLHDGRLVGEAYAPGYGVDTPLLGFSASKTVTNALVGVLVRQGRLQLDQPAPLPAWRAADDPRRAITVQHLLRQTSGLDLPQDNSGFDVNAQIMYTVRDKAADVLRLTQAELYGPLGLRHVTLDFDATGTGTGIGSSHLSASARDWARFGQLALDDGVHDGRRILPAGWMAMSTTPTLDTGYGAGWWTNRKPGPVLNWGVPWGLSQAPADAFFARGFMGNFVVVVPSRRLVLVRLSVSTQRGDDIEETDRIVGEVLAALPALPMLPGAVR